MDDPHLAMGCTSHTRLITVIESSRKVDYGGALASSLFNEGGKLTGKLAKEVN
jgi:hypothetical protein